MSQEIARLLQEAERTMKSDAKAAVAKLESAYALAASGGNDDDAAYVAEALARGWARRKSSRRSLHYARKATALAPAEQSSWSTLAKTCELIAARTPTDRKAKRAKALFRAAAHAFKKAAALAKDPEDKRWLAELARDAAAQGAP